MGRWIQVPAQSVGESESRVGLPRVLCVQRKIIEYDRLWTQLRLDVSLGDSSRKKSARGRRGGRADAIEVESREIILHCEDRRQATVIDAEPELMIRLQQRKIVDHIHLSLHWKRTSSPDNRTLKSTADVDREAGIVARSAGRKDRGFRRNDRTAEFVNSEKVCRSVVTVIEPKVVRDCGTRKVSRPCSQRLCIDAVTRKRIQRLNRSAARDGFGRRVIVPAEQGQLAARNSVDANTGRIQSAGIREASRKQGKPIRFLWPIRYRI